MSGAAAAPTSEDRIATLSTEVVRTGVHEAVDLLEGESDATVVQVLGGVNPAVAVEILLAMTPARREQIQAAAPPERREQWQRNETYPEGSVGRLMDHPTAVFPPDVTVTDAREQLRDLVRRAFVTYAFVVDPAGRLLGVLVFRELMFASPTQTLGDIMLRSPFFLSPETPLEDAMRDVLRRHYPVYPVCDADGRLVGIVRGQVLFEQRAFDISAQPGQLVGVEKEERLATPWWRSFFLRHPWLQLNLFTAFIAAGVVGFFEDTINQVVALAVFLPVLAGQSGNTGCQALAVTLRGMTLGELDEGRAGALLAKEALLGFLNGSLVGLTAAIGMWIFASNQGNPKALPLAFVVWIAMIGSCVASGIAGCTVPLALKRLGADPATASSIFLTTATDVASMGLFLGLATKIIL
jgi:magnesium transporter